MADLNFKSLNIEFGAEDSGFNKSLSKINGELKATSDLGKQLDKDLKFDTAAEGTKKLNQLLQVQEAELKGTESKAKALTSEYERLSNTDMEDIVKRQNDLKEAIDQSKEDTKDLNKQLRQMKKAADVDPSEIEALQKAIEDSKQRTKDLNLELGETNKDIQRISPQNMARLATEILKTINREKELNKQVKETKDDINNLDSGDFDKLSDKAKMAGSSMKEFGDDADTAFNEIKNGSKDAEKSLSGISEESEKASTSLADIAKGGASKALGTLTEEAGGAVEGLGGIAEGALEAGAALGPVGAVAGAAAAGIGAIAVSAKNTREIQSQLVGSINNTDVAFEDQTGTIKIAAHALGIDYVDAAQNAREMSQDFGSEIQSNGDLMGAMIANQALANTGTFEAADAYKAASSNAATFGDSMEQHNETIGKSVYMMQRYGDKADDIIDTQVEWGDTFNATGQSSEQMFNILNAGMTAGARNTDEMANAWNEFQLRLGDGTAQESVEALGLNWNDLVDDFNSGGVSSQLAFAQVIDGLYGIEDQTKRTTVAQGILGTQGEEFLGTLHLQKSETEQLVAQLKGQDTVMKAVGHTTDENADFWNKFAEANNLTAVEVSNLQQKIDSQGLSSVNTATKNAVMGESLAYIAKQNGLNKQETDNLTNAYKVYTGQMDITKMSQKEFADGLDSAHNLLGVSKNATDLLTDAYKRYQTEGLSLTTTEVAGLNSGLADLNATGKISAGQQMQLSTDMIALGKNSLTSKEGISALNDITQIFGQTGLLTGPQVEAMSKNIGTLGDKSSTAEEKTSALKGVIDGVGQAGIINQAKVDSYKQKIDDLSSASKDGTTSQDGLAGKIKDAGKAMEEQFQSLKELTEGFYDNMGPMGKFMVNQTIGKKNVDAFKTSVDGGTKSQTELNKGLKDGTNSTVENAKALNNAAKEANSSKNQYDAFSKVQKNSSKAAKEGTGIYEKQSSTLRDTKGAADTASTGFKNATTSTKNYDNQKVSKKKLENDAADAKKKYDDATNALKNYKGTDAGKKKLENDAKTAKKDYDDAKGALKDYNSVGPQNKNLKNDADIQKKKYDEAKSSLKDYNIVLPSFKDFKNTADDAKSDIDAAHEAGKGWNSFNPVEKVFTSIFKTKHEDDGKGSSSGGSRGAYDKTTNKNNYGAKTNNFAPNIQINYSGTGNPQSDGLEIGKAAARQMYKMGVVTK